MFAFLRIQMNNIEIDNIKEISLLVVMDSIKLNKTVVYHDLFLPVFRGLHHECLEAILRKS